MMRIASTRLNDKLSAELEESARQTGLKVSDLLRLGASMVIERIKKDGGLILKVERRSRPKKNRSPHL